MRIEVGTRSEKVRLRNWKRQINANRSESVAEESAAEVSSPRRLPKGALVSLIFVVLVVLGFSLYLWSQNERPGTALENWADATRMGDCDASYSGLSTSAKQAPLIGDQDNWCRIIGSPNFIGKVTVGEVKIRGNLACVHATVTSYQGQSESRVFVMIKERGFWKVDVGGDPSGTGINGCVP